MDSLAVKYRPKTWGDVTEQKSVVEILQNQIQSNELQHAYLFCGGAGTGKTTCARIFANEINKGMGNPIELDAASNNGVDDVRVIIQQSKVQSLDSEYKVYIMDEVHALSSNAWQAMLKLLEEPPAKSIFIMCTTDPQKLPKTILSRVQRYQFQRISQQGIVNRLRYICDIELREQDDLVRLEALEYIAKIADGGMRDAITLLDKCIAFSRELTLGNVVNAIGATDYETMIRLSKAVMLDNDKEEMIRIIDNIHASGKDLKLFIRSYLEFAVDLGKYDVTHSFEFIKIPQFLEKDIADLALESYELIKVLLRLNNDIKYDSNPKPLVEATFYLFMQGD